MVFQLLKVNRGICNDLTSIHPSPQSYGCVHKRNTINEPPHIWDMSLYVSLSLPNQFLIRHLQLLCTMKCPSVFVHCCADRSDTHTTHYIESNWSDVNVIKAHRLIIFAAQPPQPWNEFQTEITMHRLYGVYCWIDLNLSMDIWQNGNLCV